MKVVRKDCHSEAWGIKSLITGPAASGKGSFLAFYGHRNGELSIAGRSMHMHLERVSSQNFFAR